MITPPSHRSQNFQPAHDTLANVVTQGPRVNNVLGQILSMTNNQRQMLMAGLTEAGF